MKKPFTRKGQMNVRAMNLDETREQSLLTILRAGMILMGLFSFIRIQYSWGGVELNPEVTNVIAVDSFKHVIHETLDVIGLATPRGSVHATGIVSCPTPEASPIPEGASALASGYACTQYRNASMRLHPEQYAQFCQCVAEKSAVAPNGELPYTRMSQEDFIRLEGYAMKAALSLKVMELRNNLRGASNILTYAAFTPQFRNKVLKPDLAGTQCLPGRIGSYLDGLVASGKCSADALTKINNSGALTVNYNGTTPVPESRRYVPNATRNFGHFLEDQMADTFTRRFEAVRPEGVNSPDTVRAEWILAQGTENAVLIQDLDPNIGGVEGGSIDPNATPHAVLLQALRAYQSDRNSSLSDGKARVRAFFEQLTEEQKTILAQNAVIFTNTSEYNPHATNPANALTIRPQLFARYIENLSSDFRMSEADLLNFENPATMARLRGQFGSVFQAHVGSEIDKALEDCQRFMVKEIEEKICPVINNQEYRLSDLVRVLGTGELRSQFGRFMRLASNLPISGDASAKIEFNSEQLLCYSYADRTAMKTVFSYNAGKPITSASTVFSINPSTIAGSDLDDIPDAADLNQQEVAARNVNGAIGDRMRNSGSSTYVVDREQLNTIVRSYSSSNSGDNSGQGSSKSLGGSSGGGGGKSNSNGNPNPSNPDPSGLPIGGNGEGIGGNSFGAFGGGSSFNNGSSFLPNGGTLGGGQSGGATLASDGSDSSGPAVDPTADFNARFAELQRQIEEREKRLAKALAGNGAKGGDSIVGGARDRDEEIASLRGELEKLKKELKATREAAKSAGISLPAATPAKAVAGVGDVSGGKSGAGGASPPAAPGAPGASGGRVTVVSPGLAPSFSEGGPGGGSTGQSLTGSDLSTSLGFTRNFGSAPLTLNGNTFEPGSSTLLISRVDFDGADDVKRGQIYALAAGRPIYVVNQDNSISIYVAQGNGEEGLIVYVPEGTPSAPVVAKKGTGSKGAKRAPASVVPVPTATPTPTPRVRHSELLDVIEGAGN